MLRTLSIWIAGISLLMASWTSLAQTNQPVAPVGPGPVYSLDQFGPVTTADQAEATFQKASRDIIAAGGGVLVVPAPTAPDWKVRNISQEDWRKPAPPAPAKSWGAGPGVTVLDARGGTVKISPPQVTGLKIERVLDLPEGQSLPFWDYFPVVSVRNTILHGSTSYRDWLQEGVTAGKDRRFYVATIRGIFPGMFMSIGEWGIVQRLYVKSLGYDKEKQLWYFVADTEADQPKGAIMGNKNHVSVLNLETYSHNENQTFDVRMWRHNYSQGDNYLVDARFKYMSDVHSTAGDENGVIYGAFIESELNIFRGAVEKWDPETGELKFKPADGRTLGSGRPIINLNPAKWITNGTVVLVRPASWIEDSTAMENSVYQGQSYPTIVRKDRVGIPVIRMGGLIRCSADAPVTAAAVGRYFAVDEPDECVPRGGKIRRWYLIDKVTKNADGTTDLEIIRHWWGAKPAAAPTLYQEANYSRDGHVKPLRYIIAPGANAYDVSDGVESPKRTIKLVPTPFAGTAADFAANDPIEQAIGPDPYKPIPFRSWIWDAVPGVFPSPVFDVGNHGPIMRDSVLCVRAGFLGDLGNQEREQYDHQPQWDKYLDLLARCNTGIRFGSDTDNAAILFEQPHQRVQPIKWYYGTESNQPPKVASLTVSRETGELTFTGGGARFAGPVTATGLSADRQPARNLRGKNVAVKAGDTAMTVTFPVEEADGDYAVFVEQSWLGNRAITKKDAKGFTIQFEKPATEGGWVDWMIVR